MPRPSLAPRRGAAAFDGPDPLGDFAGVFTNPGALRMRTFVPAGLSAGAPLVVVLHGCTQAAAGYDRAAGWSRLAAANGFALLFPEQVRANNPNLCFNWFEAGDTTRGGGEVASIANAVAAVVARHGLDSTRVFVTGLSAGGAMANACLAAYPDVFAGGAIIAGLPFGAAQGVGPAMAAMAHPAVIGGPALGDRVREASGFSGPWPRVSVWHGSADRTVRTDNGVAVAEQWADVHQATPGTDGDRRIWRNAAGVVVVDYNEIKDMGHGTPIDSDDGGEAAPFMLDVGVASSARIAAFWGIGTAAVPPRDSPGTRPARPRDAAAPARPSPVAIITDALRAAGLLK